MQINSNISFRANHIHTTQIKKLNPVTKSYGTCRANFVEFVSEQDVEALKWVSENWKAIFSTDIFSEAKYKLPKNEYYSNSANDSSRFFAITLQNDSFDVISPEKILGVTEVTDGFWEGVYNLDYLLVKPAYKYMTKEREYKHVGTAIINEIKKICSDKALMLTSGASAREFYIKNGFTFDQYAAENMMFWEKIK